MALFWLFQGMVSVLLICTGFIHGVMWAISLVDSKGLVTNLRYRRSQGISAGTAAVGTGITSMSIFFALVLSVVHYLLYQADLGVLSAGLPILIAIFYALVLPPVLCTAFVGVVLMYGFVLMLRKRAAVGTDDPSRVEAPTRQPLEIDMEVYIWEKLRRLALELKIHAISEIGGIVGAAPTGIFFGGIVMLLQLYEPNIKQAAFPKGGPKMPPGWGF